MVEISQNLQIPNVEKEKVLEGQGTIPCVQGPTMLILDF